MATVAVTPNAQKQFFSLPLPIQARVRGIFARLANWPATSGAKPLRGELAGNFRIRTGDYRVVFQVEGAGADAVVTIWKIGYRGDVYD
jgi:mRNA-degrading endonuclease RelE of RelBE toxin-antitoxin system